MNVTFGGKEMKLSGQQRNVGDQAPDFTLIDNDLVPKSLHDYSGKKLIVTVPSLDTGVCDLEATRFNQEAEKMKDVTVITVSMDLPFAQKRWCVAKEVETMVMLSDYKERKFATDYGVYLEDLALLTRAIFALDENNKITYIEIVPEVTDHPDYDAALAAVK